MDPLLNYYLCTKDGETVLWATEWWEADALEEYDEVQQLPYWQALQLTVSLMQMERSSSQAPGLFPLSEFMGADEDLIAELFGGDDPR